MWVVDEIVESNVYFVIITVICRSIVQPRGRPETLGMWFLMILWNVRLDDPCGRGLIFKDPQLPWYCGLVGHQPAPYVSSNKQQDSFGSNFLLLLTAVVSILPRLLHSYSQPKLGENDFTFCSSSYPCPNYVWGRWVNCRCRCKLSYPSPQSVWGQGVESGGGVWNASEWKKVTEKRE